MKRLFDLVFSALGLLALALPLLGCMSTAIVLPRGSCINERFENEFTEIFGIEPSALTANEASCLVSFKSIDAIRNRLAAAEQEIDRRLRSNGIERTNEATPPRCRIPDDRIDSRRSPLFMARAVMAELIEQLESSKSPST